LSESDVIRVLIADDHAGFRAGLSEALATCGFTVVGQASSGREAFESSIFRRPQVVVMDINMAGMDGVEATRLIRSKLPGVQVVGLSVNETTRVQRDLIEAGASALLNKNASIEEICGAIRNAVAVP
jgi:DNA-binding NarL/FixJ family response regulator